MISRDKASSYYCTKDRKHHEVSMSGQKKRCWQCGAKMVEKPSTSVVIKG